MWRSAAWVPCAATDRTVELICRVRDLQRAVASFERSIERRYGICLNGSMMLCSLHRAGRRLSAGELAEWLGLTASNASKVLAALERKGLIGRVPGCADRRRTYFELTPAGERLLGEIRSGSPEVPPLLLRALAAADE